MYSAIPFQYVIQSFFDVIGFPQPLIGIAQGTSALTRIGRKIMLKSLLLTGHITMQPTPGTSLNDIVYLYIILDRQANGAYPAIADIWSEVVPAACLRNLDTAKRFKILKTMMWTLNASDASTPVIQDFEIFLKMNKWIDFSSDTGAITEIKSNNILCVWGSDFGVSTIAGSSRVRFTDP